MDYVTACHGYSERRACELTRQHRSNQRKPSTRDPRTAVHQLVMVNPASHTKFLTLPFAVNGAEFTSQLVDLWAYNHGTRIDFSRPAKPTDNAFIETYNGSLRDECLNIHWFETIAEAQQLIEAWKIQYNERRPHMALGNKSPAK